MAAPGPVTELDAIRIGTTTLTLTWVNPEDLDLAEIIVRRAEGDDSPGRPRVTAMKSLSLMSSRLVEDTDVALNTMYSYSVWAKNATDRKR